MCHGRQTWEGKTAVRRARTDAAAWPTARRSTSRPTSRNGDNEFGGKTAARERDDGGPSERNRRRRAWEREKAARGTGRAPPTPPQLFCHTITITILYTPHARTNYDTHTHTRTYVPTSTQTHAHTRTRREDESTNYNQHTVNMAAMRLAGWTTGQWPPSPPPHVSPSRRRRRLPCPVDRHRCVSVIRLPPPLGHCCCCCYRRRRRRHHHHHYHNHQHHHHQSSSTLRFGCIRWSTSDGTEGWQ